MRVVHSGDHLDRLGGRRRVGGLLPLDLLVQHEVQVVQRGQEPSQEGVAGLADRKSHAGSPHAARSMQLWQEEREALRLVAPLLRTQPVVEAGAHDAHAATGGVEIASQRVDLGIRGDGERPPQLTRLELDDRRDPRGHDPHGDLGRSDARRGSRRASS